MSEAVDLFGGDDLLASFDVFKSTRPDLTSYTEQWSAYLAYSYALAHPTFPVRRRFGKRPPKFLPNQPDMFGQTTPAETKSNDGELDRTVHFHLGTRILIGDCRDLLCTLPDASVHCVVTSPPYFGLRDYGTAKWEGGDPACDHIDMQGGTRRDVSGERLAERAALYGTGTGSGSAVRASQFRDACGKCGAKRVDSQIGLEASPDAFVAELVAVFRQVRRVLRDDGTLWLNLGDSYATQPAGNKVLNRPFDGGAYRSNIAMDTTRFAKAKDLMMMPARVALALQADGWYLRSDIIWHKPNPMPESVTDRPTSSHEHVFLLAKSPRYFFDAEAVREDGITGDMRRPYGSEGAWQLDGRPTEQRHGGELRKVNGRTSAEYQEVAVKAGRNIRNVWTIATAPFAAAHFATFPPELAERCIKAGTSEKGCCAKCGAPMVRVVERESFNHHQTTADGKTMDGPYAKQADIRNGKLVNVTTTGWRPSCECEAAVAPCTVLDPFAGAGTALLVADRLQRKAIGIELSSDYGVLARDRVTKDAGLFASVMA